MFIHRQYNCLHWKSHKMHLNLLVSKFCKVAGFKVNIWKTFAFLCISNKNWKLKKYLYNTIKKHKMLRDESNQICTRFVC